NQRNRRSVGPPWRDRTYPCVGAYVQSRPCARARELSGPRDDRLQGRGRALAAALSFSGSCQLPLKSAFEGLFRRPGSGFASKSKEFSDFLKCPASKSLERDEANEINNRYDEHGSRQAYY